MSLQQRMYERQCCVLFRHIAIKDHVPLVYLRPSGNAFEANQQLSHARLGQVEVAHHPLWYSRTV